MKQPEDVARRMSRDWLAKAAVDLLVCERLEGADLSEAVAFHAQQAAEKSIKALLVARQVEFPKTHDIERLVELVASGDDSLAAALADAAELTPYGVEYRYPGDHAPVSHAEARKCVSRARTVYDEVVLRLSDAAGQ